jgi:hypothetical protein
METQIQETTKIGGGAVLRVVRTTATIRRPSILIIAASVAKGEGQVWKRRFGRWSEYWLLVDVLIRGPHQNLALMMDLVLALATVPQVQ